MTDATFSSSSKEQGLGVTSPLNPLKICGRQGAFEFGVNAFRLRHFFFLAVHFSTRV